MQLVKEEVLNLMRNNRQTRVSIILNPEIIREETEFTTDIEYDYRYFQGGVIDNLAATDEKENITLQMKQFKKDYKIIIREEVTGI